MRYYIYCKRKEDGFIHLSAICETQKEVDTFLKIIKGLKVEDVFDFWVEERKW